MSKTERRRAFITRKKDFLAQGQEGNRSRDAYFKCFYLDLVHSDVEVATRNHFSGVIARNVKKAWKNRDAKFFDDISRTIERTIKQGTENVDADPRRRALVDNWLRIHCRDKKKKYTLSEIIQICGLSKGDKKTASILRTDFGQWRKTVRSNTIFFV